ncbi:MAG: hypothetical protein J6T05_06430 [Prevotella sp.]|nr:hypothetical protein [Prevotella sp.]
MKKIYSVFTLLVVALTGLSLTACSNDDLDTQQYKGGVALNVYGPSPVMRGGQLRFLGSNLDQVREVIIPDGISITNIQVVSAGVPSEIRVTVPKDGPVEGLVTLVTNSDQRITTKTPLKYEEGIEITKMTASAMPGDVVKIEGDYLNLIHSLAFADNVLVSEADFVSHDRYAIEVKVPEEAKTGKLELYTADLTVIDKSSVEYQIIKTDEAIEIGVPAISKIKGRGEAEALGNIVAKAGEKITITGTYFNVVADVTIGGVSATEMTISEEGTTLVVTLPAEAPSGEIILVCKSGVEVPVGTLETVKPTNAVAAPNPVKAGAALTISGQDMDIVASVAFPAGDATVDGGEITVAADKVIVKAVPETATEGTLKLVMASGETVDVAFTLVKPTVTSYSTSSVSAGGALSITGTNLDLVKTVQFGEGSDIVNVEGTATLINLTVPMNAKSGSPIMKLANGTAVQNVPSINVTEAVFCYFTELPAEDAELKAGDSFMLPVANGDKLTGVEINGEACQYVLTSNNQLIIGIPTTAKKGSKVRLISSNGEITYIIDFIPNTEVTTVLWTGTVDLGSWSNNWEIGKGVYGDNNPNMFKDMDLQAGDVIRVYVTPYNDWWNVKFYDGHWNAQDEAGIAAGLAAGPEINPGNYNLSEHGGAIEFTATATMVEQLTTITDWGMCWIVNGEGAVITKIAVTHYNSFETTLWTGDVDFGSWSFNWEIGKGTNGDTNPNMFVDAGLKVGQVIRVYITPYNDWWQVQFFDGHWTVQSEIGNATGLNNGNNVNPNIYNLADHNGAIEINVTDRILSDLTTLTDWGYCWIIQGENCHATKITVE